MTSTDSARTAHAMPWLLASGACFAMAAAVMSTINLPRSDASARPVESSEITNAVDSLRPNCRMIARHRLKHRLDMQTRSALTDEDLDEVLDPLRKGGSDLCEAITVQSFTLGGS
jgi:hypothetical protein